MKKIRYWLVTLLLVVVNLCKSDTNYFPLTIDNYWVYSRDDDSSGTYQYTIFDTTMIEDNLPSVEEAIKDLKKAWEEAQSAEAVFKQKLMKFGLK